MGATQASLWMDADALARKLEISLTDLDERLSDGTVETLEYGARRLFRSVSSSNGTGAANDTDRLRVVITPENTTQSVTVDAEPIAFDEKADSGNASGFPQAVHSAENAWNQVVTLVDRYEDRIDALLGERKQLAASLRESELLAERNRSEANVAHIEGQRMVDMERQTRHSAELERDRARVEVRTLRDQGAKFAARLQVHKQLQGMAWWRFADRAALKKCLAMASPVIV